MDWFTVEFEWEDYPVIWRRFELLASSPDDAIQKAWNNLGGVISGLEAFAYKSLPHIEQ